MSRTLGIITRKRLTMQESQESLPGSGMEDADSITANAGAASVPSQIHQLAAVLWDILNNDRNSNALIFEKLENHLHDEVGTWQNNAKQKTTDCQFRNHSRIHEDYQFQKHRRIRNT